MPNVSACAAAAAFDDDTKLKTTTPHTCDDPHPHVHRTVAPLMRYFGFRCLACVRLYHEQRIIVGQASLACSQ
jgi:hypothetical protein